MLDLKQFTPQAMVDIRPLLALQQYRSCDYSIGGIYMWREFFGEKYAVEDGMLICTVEYFDEGHCYTMPVGCGDLRSALMKIKRDAMERGLPFRFCSLTPKGLEELKAILGEPTQITEHREWADYLYPYENFLGYHGKKLVTPRNHCNRFVRDYPQYVYEAITMDNIEEATAFLAMKADCLEKTSPIAIEDHIRAVEVMSSYFEFGFIGGILKVDGITVGVTVGEIIGDTLYVQIEKALTDYSGAYPMLAQLFARQAQRPGVDYINREDDSGDEGLRHSKTEYRPCELIMKYTADFDIQ